MLHFIALLIFYIFQEYLLLWATQLNLFYKVSSRALAYAAEELRTDREFVLQVIKLSPRALEHVAKELRTDHEFILGIVASICTGVLAAPDPWCSL